MSCGNKGITLQDAVIDEALSTFINSRLQAEHDFFVYRSVEYLRWKYIDNPSVNACIKTVMYNNESVGFVAFSMPKSYRVSGVVTSSIKITDIVIIKNCGLSTKDVVCAIIRDCKERNVYVDGILSNNKIIGLPEYEYDCLDVLSSLAITNPIKNAYLTLLDQDMEQ